MAEGENGSRGRLSSQFPQALRAARHLIDVGISMYCLQRMWFLGICGMLLVLGCGQPAASPPSANAPTNAPVVQAPGSNAPASGGPVIAADPATGARAGSPPGLEINDFAWLDSRKDLPFVVREYLAQRKPGAEEERRLALYRQGLGLISSDLGSPQSADLQRRIGEAANSQKLLAGEFSDAQIAQIVADSRPAVALLDQAQSTPLSAPRRMVFAYALRADALYPEVQAARGVARLATIEFYHARRTKQLEPAHQAFERTLQLSRDLQPQGPMICQLVSMAMDNALIESVTRLLLDHPNLSPADCDRLLKALTRHEAECLPRYGEAIKGDYLAVLNTLTAMRAGKLDAKTALEGLGSGMPKDFQMSLVDLETDYAATSKLMGLALQDSEIPYSKLPATTRFATEFDRLKTLAADRSQWPSGHFPFMTVLMIPATETARDALARSETAIHGLQSLLALRRFELTHGSLPPNLEAATTEAGLKEVPQDLYDGSRLKYTLNNGAALVYSVGKDKRDDGGKGDWNFGQQAGDYLFPLPPLPPRAAPSAVESPKTAETSKAQSSRKWTSTAGTSIEATLVSFDEKEVVLKRTDGKELRVPVDKLSEADREWLKQQK